MLSHYERMRGSQVGIRQEPHGRDPVCPLAILLPDGRQTRRDSGPGRDFRGCPSDRYHRVTARFRVGTGGLAARACRFVLSQLIRVSRMVIKELAAGNGTIGVTTCPGILVAPGDTRSPAERLVADLQDLLDWGTTALVTLLEDVEFEILNVQDLGSTAMAMGMTWIHLPIADHTVPGEWFENLWPPYSTVLCGMLASGKKVAIHSRSGYERNGMVAARLLVETGLSDDEALARARTIASDILLDAARVNWVQQSRSPS